MSNFILVEGNTSDHGGNAIYHGASKTKAGGITIAYVTLGVSGDPKPGHAPNAIASSNTSGKTKFNGMAVAAQGALTQCGASLNATDSITKIC